MLDITAECGCTVTCSYEMGMETVRKKAIWTKVCDTHKQQIHKELEAQASQKYDSQIQEIQNEKQRQLSLYNKQMKNL